MRREKRLPLANFMGQAGWGSFALVGERLVADASPAGPRRYLALEIGETCQLKCKHCIYHLPKSLAPRPKQVLLDEIGACAHDEFNPLWITFAGKEPTIYPRQLVDLASRLRRPETLSILMTNGLLLDDDLIDELAGKIDLFDISIDGTEQTHDWMRGEGTYSRTWNRVEAVLKRTGSRVGLIATAVRGEIAPGVRQHEGIGELAREVVARCGTDSRVVLTVSLYFGQVGDPMLLRSEDIVSVIRSLASSGCPSRVLVTSNYAHQWPAISRELQINAKPVLFDERTGLPVVQYGSVNILLFNLTQVPQVSARVSNDGLVFLGCNHLTLGARAVDHAIGDVQAEGLASILRRISDGSHEVYARFEDTPAPCAACPTYDACRSGDRLSGMLFTGVALDPYCEVANEGTWDEASNVMTLQPA